MTNNHLDEKMKMAANAYEQGCSCAQAVLMAYAKELSISEETAFRMMEGFSRGIGNNDGICGVVAAASIVISTLSSDGLPNRDCTDTYRYIDAVSSAFRKEYGGLSCKEILKGSEPYPQCCQMKVKDMILLIEQTLHIIEKEKPNRSSLQKTPVPALSA